MESQTIKIMWNLAQKLMGSKNVLMRALGMMHIVRSTIVGFAKFLEVN